MKLKSILALALAGLASGCDDEFQLACGQKSISFYEHGFFADSPIDVCLTTLQIFELPLSQYPTWQLKPVEGCKTMHAIEFANPPIGYHQTGSSSQLTGGYLAEAFDESGRRGDCKFQIK